MSNEEQKRDFQHNLLVAESILLELGRNFPYAELLYGKYSFTDLNDHWRLIRYGFFRLIILDLAKVFINNKDTHKTNLFRFLSRMEGGGDYKKIALPKARIAFYREQLALHSKAIAVITLQRNEYIAHTDQLFGITPGSQFFPAVKELLNLGFTIVNELSETILNRPGLNNMGKIDLTGLVTVDFTEGLRTSTL